VNAIAHQKALPKLETAPDAGLEQHVAGVAGDEAEGNGCHGDDQEPGKGDPARPEPVGVPAGEVAREQRADALGDEQESCAEHVL
jgi:hypothetical protein